MLLALLQVFGVNGEIGKYVAKSAEEVNNHGLEHVKKENVR